MIRSVRFEPEGPETRTKRRKPRNSVIEKRIRVRPLVDVNIKFDGLTRDLRLNIRDKKASFLIGWYSGMPAPEIITTSESIERFVVARIERLRREVERARTVANNRSRLRRSDIKMDLDERAVKIDIMKNSLGVVKDENGNWSKNPTEITHALKIPSKFGVTTDHAILTIGADGLTVTPLTEQKGWVKMITPKVYTFTVNFKPGESAMVKFGFKW
jgi:hypothetical protein